MVAQARVPLTDSNGRPTVVVPLKEQNAEATIEALNAKIRNLEHTILQMKRSKKEERDKRAYKCYTDQGRFRGSHGKCKGFERHDGENASP